MYKMELEIYENNRGECRFCGWRCEFIDSHIKHSLGKCKYLNIVYDWEVNEDGTKVINLKKKELPIINFGKYKDYEIDKVPRNYLIWLYKKNEEKHLSPYMKKIMDFIREMVDLNEEVYKNMKILFGKYKDKRIDEVDIEYLKWLLKKNKGKEENTKYMNDLILNIEKLVV